MVGGVLVQVVEDVGEAEGGEDVVVHVGAEFEVGGALDLWRRGLGRLGGGKGGGGGACHEAGPVHAGGVHPFCAGFFDEEELVCFFLWLVRKFSSLRGYVED